MATENDNLKNEASNLPAIESASTEGEELQQLLSGYSSAFEERGKKNFLNGRYEIHTDQPLSHLNTTFGKAYRVTDSTNEHSSLYAMVLSASLPYRLRAMEQLKELRHPNLVNLYDFGTVTYNGSDETRMTLVLQQPVGKSLQFILSEAQKGIPESYILKHFLPSLANILSKLQSLNLCHGRINLDTIYFDGQNLMIGECLSEPCGFSQPYYYEPFERITADASGKGEGNPLVDSFACGIALYILFYGNNPFTSLNREAYLRKATELGTYNTLIGNREIPITLQDIFRGTMNDQAHERWSANQLVQAAGGKRFNLIHPSVPREAPRPFVFNGTEYFNRRSLSVGLQMEWDRACIELREGKLSRWLELSVHKTELSDVMNRLVRSTGGETSKSERESNEMVAKTIALLDSSGVLRLKQIATRIEGLGSALAHCFITRERTEKQYLAEMIEMDLPDFWAEYQNGAASNEASGVLWKLQKIRSQLRIMTLGFGLERCLYELNPGLPCQSPLVLKYHVTTIKELLLALDHIARQKAADNDPMDRHIAAFIASRLDLVKEVRITELEQFPEFRTHPMLVTLKLLCLAQEKTGNLRFKGLASWVAMRIIPLLDKIHNRTARKRYAQDIRSAAKNGALIDIFTIFAGGGIAKEDSNGFIQAMNLYQRNLLEIQSLQNRDKLRSDARETGIKTALFGTYGLCLASGYSVIKLMF